VFVIDNTVSRVMFQFSFSNPRFVPSTIKQLQPETKKEHEARNASQGPRVGTMIIVPTEKSSLKDFVPDLEALGFELVGASHQERIDPKDVRKERKYHMVRFVFARSEDAQISSELMSVQEVIRAELQEMCNDALWRVRAYSNPFVENDDVVPNQWALSFNFEARTPLFNPEGEPVVVWQKDENGKRTGDAPVPIAPQFILRILEEGEIRLVTN
jgi:hypothetical protein